MNRPKRMRRFLAVCTIVNISLSGCANHESRALISSVGISSVDDGHATSGYGSNISVIQSTSQIDQPHIEGKISMNSQNQMNVSLKENTIYNRSYENIKKGSYFGRTYQVKPGDTLFYIAWITGSNYRDLAKRNNIYEPYNLNIGQILLVDERTTPIIENIQAGDVMVSNANNQVNPVVVAAPVPNANIRLAKSNIDPIKNGNFSESLSKQSIGNMLPSFNHKILPTSDLTVTTTMPITKPKTDITGWYWPTDGKIIDNFSTKAGGNKGVDISGYRGQPILATANGRVVYAGNALRGYGNLIIIKHNDDYLSAYAHNETLLVREQQEVRAGQKIATMGNTGTNTIKLHFEIRYKGKSVNPLYYLPQ